MEKEQKYKQYKNGDYVISETDNPYVYFFNRIDGAAIKKIDDSDIYNLYLKMITLKYFSKDKVDLTAGNIMIEESLNKEYIRITGCVNNSQSFKEKIQTNFVRKR